jgi:hypothetical protein
VISEKAFYQTQLPTRDNNKSVPVESLCMYATVTEVQVFRRWPSLQGCVTYEEVLQDGLTTIHSAQAGW